MFDVDAAAGEGPLARLPAEVRTRLLQGHTLVRAAAGQPLHRPGDVEGLHLVGDGLVRVSLASEQGRQVTVCYSRRGDVLGVPVHVSGAAPVRAHAITDAVIISARPDALLRAARQDPNVAMWIAEQLAHRVDDLLQEMAINAFWPVRRRLIRHLLDLAADEQDGDALVARVSHQDLADHVGTVREVVARTLADLRAESLIHTNSDGITLRDPIALAQETH